MLSASRKGPAFKPQLRVCYLCGQQFGSASIAIHIPQCYSKKVAQWEISDPATRGRKPKHPDTVNWKGEGISIDKLNDEQFHEFTSNLVPCQNCGRKFLPDRLVVHLRSCKGDNGRTPTKAAGGGGSKFNNNNNSGSGGGFNGTIGSSQSATQRSIHSATTPRSLKKSASNSPARTPGYKPQLPICYLCGQQFGSTSIAIHVPQCYAKKLAQWEAADVHTRGKPPKHPDSVNWKSEGTGIDEHNDAQFAEFVNNLEPCPNCGRKFLADRLIVHLRSCKPGSTARPPPQLRPRTSESPTSTERNNNNNNNNNTDNMGNMKIRTTGGVGGGSSSHSSHENSKINKMDDNSSGFNSTKDVDKLNPKTRRLPKDGKVDPEGRTCHRCGVVEYDMNAKYCRDCGSNLISNKLPNPCNKCGENIPEGSRFCGTCGTPIDGAAASERIAGAENINAPSIRVVVCPACKAVCDADGNFCDNCGAALGDVEPSTMSEVTTAATTVVAVVREVMFCKNCSESVEEITAKYCEECGGILEKVSVNTLDGEPHKNPSTLPPSGVKSINISKVGASSVIAEPGKINSEGKSDSTPKNISPKYEETKKSDTNNNNNNNNTQNAFRDGAIKKNSSPSNFTSEEFNDNDGEDVIVDLGERVECTNCGRKFVSEALERHQRACLKQKKRPVFNTRARRLSGKDAARTSRSNSSGGINYNNSNSPRPATSVPKKDWRAESEAFRRAMREARMVDKVLKSGGNARDLPPPTYSENSHYIPCQHCGRKFAPDVAERHIPRCASTVNKPKPPPRRR